VLGAALVTGGVMLGVTGLAMLGAALSIGVVSLFLAAPAIGRLGERNTLLIGLFSIAVSMLLTWLPVDARYLTNLLPSMVLLGGFGLAITALTGLGMSSSRSEDAGLASGLFNTGQQVGAALGVAVLGSIAGARTTARSAAGVEQNLALTGGFRLAFGVGAGFLVAAVLISLLVLRPSGSPAVPQVADGPEDGRSPIADRPVDVSSGRRVGDPIPAGRPSVARLVAGPVRPDLKGRLPGQLDRAVQR
jgi:MFS family permease